jgi:beta-lactamase regulating signal transducer with metallopeptidase domain
MMLTGGGTAAMQLLTQADSARSVASVYAVSLLATVPLAIVAIAAFFLRHASAEARSLIWRSAIVALLVVFIGRQLPLHWVAWVVPSALAAPLVVLGRVQVTATSLVPSQGAGDPLFGASLVRGLFLVYAAGVAIILVPTAVGLIRARSRLRRAMCVHGGRWERALDDVRATLGITRSVRIFVDVRVAVPMTWGSVRPVVVLPRAATTWTYDQLRIVLMHELGHVRARDWTFNLIGRVVCALYWFHPGVWWVARGLREDCELACDDRVIAAGVRRSDYAELLVSAAAALTPARTAISPALALSERRGLRARLTAVLDIRHDVRPLRRGWATVAAMATLTVAGPMSAVQLAPSREVLTTLMLDARWESRAYAVLGLAQRRDSIAVAQSAAELDPNPRVRAWARYALGQRGDLPELRTILRD